jgi:hypothetical protein
MQLCRVFIPWILKISAVLPYGISDKSTVVCLVHIVLSVSVTCTADIGVFLRDLPAD